MVRKDEDEDEELKEFTYLVLTLAQKKYKAHLGRCKVCKNTLLTAYRQVVEHGRAKET